VTEIPLFPLSSVLFPHGSMPLQIFEPRYLDLVRDCMRQGSGFGVVLIREGHEVAAPGRGDPALAERGCYARITDFDQLPNGLLGVTIQGSERFTLYDSRRADSGLVLGQVEIDPPLARVPMAPAWEPLRDVLQRLEAHPHIQRLQLALDYADAWQVGNVLAQLLPLEETVKYELLCATDIDELMSRLDLILNRLGEEG
jgi:Lon protease-like protein